MKRIWALAAGIMLLFGLGNPMVAEAAETAGTISVSGQAVVEAAPDWVVVRVGVSELAPTASEAMTKASALLEQVAAAAVKLGVATEQIQTQNLWVQPEYRYEEVQTGAGQVTKIERNPILVGYRVNSTLAMGSADLAGVGKLVDAAVKAGANTVDGVEFTIKDRSNLELKALGQATSAAKAKAEAVATALGRAVGPAKAVNVGQAGGSSVRFDLAPAPSVDRAAGQEAFIAPGQVQMLVTVQIEFELR